MRSVLTILTLVALVLLGCNNDLESISQVSKFRILAVSADPPEVGPGDSSTLRALFANPEKKKIQALWIGFKGLLKPTSNPGDIPVQEWPPILLDVEGEYTGVSNYGDLFVRTDFLADKALNDYDAQPCAEPNRAQATVIVLLCAGGQIDLAGIAMGMSGSDQSADITSLFTNLCKGDNAESVLAFKTFMVSDPADRVDLPNTNPQIELFEFDKKELSPTADAEDIGTFQCEGEDGCRDSIKIRARLTEDSYSEYTKYYYDERGAPTSCEPINDRTYISWFIDGGEFDKDRSGTEDPPDWYEAEWLPPREGGEYLIWAVAHDVRGGVSWKLYRVEAVPPQ